MYLTSMVYLMIDFVVDEHENLYRVLYRGGDLVVILGIDDPNRMSFSFAPAEITLSEFTERFRPYSPIPEYRGFKVLQLEQVSHGYWGRVDCKDAVVTFQGKALNEAAQAFRDSVDDYLEFLAEYPEDTQKLRNS